MNGKDLYKINDNLKASRSMADTMWQDIADNIVFRKASIVGKVQAGVKLTQKMYDSTATVCAHDLAAWINGNMTASGMDWYSLRLAGLQKEDKSLQEQLEQAKKIHYEAFRDSNWAGEWNEVLLDLVQFNTGALHVEENEIEKPGFNGFNFIPMPPGTYCVILDRARKAKGMFRELEIKAQEAMDRWPKKVSAEIEKDAEKDPSKLHPFIHACFPKKWFGGKHKTQHEFVSYYVDAKKKTIMSTGGYDDFPFFVIPWLRESGEDYGRGPGWTALPDVKTAHRATELSLKEWALSIWPPVTARDQGVIGSVRWDPGGITVVKEHDDVKPWVTGARFSDNRLRMEDLTNKIREIFHNDKVKFIPPREQTGQMTAYEVARRYQLAQQLLGPTFGNIIDHGLDPLIEVTFNMMNRAGAFGEGFDLPENVQIEYESPLARAQRIHEVESIQNTMEAAAGLLEVKPDIMDNFKLDETAIHVAKILGYPAKLINTEDEREGMRNARAPAQQQQQALEQAALGAKAAKDAAGAAKDAPPGIMEQLTAGA